MSLLLTCLKSYSKSSDKEVPSLKEMALTQQRILNIDREIPMRAVRQNDLAVLSAKKAIKNELHLMRVKNRSENQVRLQLKQNRNQQQRFLRHQSNCQKRVPCGRLTHRM